MIYGFISLQAFRQLNCWLLIIIKSSLKKFSPLEFSLSYSAAGFFVISASVLCRSPLPPPRCLCRFVSRMPWTLRGDQEGREPSCSPCAGSLCWAGIAEQRAAISPGRFTRVVQTQSGFFFYWIIIKNFCQVLSVGRGGWVEWGEYTKSSVQLDQPLKNINLNEAGMPCTSLIFYI